MKQFLLHLDETLALGRKFILQDLDETHLFISSDIVETLQARVDDLMDQLSIPVHDKGMDTERRKVLDDAARKRRARKAVEALEQDNFHEDPHADLVMSKKVPKFADSNEKPTRKKKSKSAEYYKMRFRKTFAQLVEEDASFRPDPPNYLSAQVPPSKFPDRHFCAVCGFPSNYTCIPCGARYCSVRCLGTHLDTRCLKWTA
ncbi:hypothetical protein B5X24_HaOG213454 [Helicoverpa armigera]|nr:hypothetical protein B5X24_HaOG213454 [Helicoverpa armigera]